MRAALLIPASLGALFLGAIAVAASGQQLARLNLEETQLTAEQAHNMSQLSRLLSVLEQLRRDPPPALLVSPQDAKDAVRAAILVKAMTPELQVRAAGYAKVASDMMRQRRLAAVESEALFTTQSESADLTPEADQPAQAAVQDRAEGPLTAPDRLAMPAAGAVVRKFGEALASGGQANGVTIATTPGAAVQSPAGALVQYVGPVKGWGVILILKLAGGYHLVLAGLDRSSVQIGQSVASGQAVGTMPDGKQSNSELYLEVREQGAPVDPGRWLNKSAG